MVAETGGGPNGAAIGPDGKLYVRNNGGSFDYIDMGGLKLPAPAAAETFEGGRIERIDIDSGEVEVLYEECDGSPLRGPNDIVFDAHGGFWFTDHGLRAERTQRPHRHLLRPAGRLLDPRGDLPDATPRTASGCRPTARGSTSPRPHQHLSGGGRSPAPGEVEEVAGPLPARRPRC